MDATHIPLKRQTVSKEAVYIVNLYLKAIISSETILVIFEMVCGV